MINSKQAHKYCSEDISLIEGYEAAISDYTQVWEIHHRLEVNAFNARRSDGGIVSRKQLIEDGMYWNRPAAELIFLTRAQHSSLHNKAGKIGEKNVKIMNAKLTHEQRVKAGVGRIGGKIVGKMPWWTDGSTTRRSVECPGPGWVRGRLRKKKA